MDRGPSITLVTTLVSKTPHPCLESPGDLRARWQGVTSLPSYNHKLNPLVTPYLHSLGYYPSLELHSTRTNCDADSTGGSLWVLGIVYLYLGKPGWRLTATL
eukprot:sb/3478356/